MAVKQTNAKPPAIFLMGPTASGKTDLAVRLVQTLPLEIISVDSAMVYRGMDIGTAKPDADTLQKAPHRLIDILDPVDSYSAADFRQDALREMEDITAAGRIPLLVGGTMLYFRALYQGLSGLPSADEKVRMRLEQQASEQGWPAMHRRLQEIDPQSAARIHPNDPQRIQRALEVYQISGEPLSVHFGRQRKADFPYRLLQLALMAEDRKLLHERIERRFRQMLELGLVDEVRSLYERKDINADLPSMRSVGYRQVLKYLQGDYTYELMVVKGITATRQLAKRQITWLRSEKDAIHLECMDNSLYDRVLRLVQQTGCG